MRRLIVILMLTLLPLHLGWAAMSAYCQHEAGAAAQHLGHHFHAHHGEEDGTQKAHGKIGAQADADCGVCHLSPAQMPVAAVGIAMPLPATTALVPMAVKGYRSFYPSGLDRPNWRRSL